MTNNQQAGDVDLEATEVTASVLFEVARERSRQDAKWGTQNHPLVDPVLLHRPHTRMAEEFEIPTALRATQLCQGAAARGEVTWAHILVEEVAEFVAAAQHDQAEARAELVQVAAVAIAAVEAIDRRGGDTDGE